MRYIFGAVALTIFFSGTVFSDYSRMIPSSQIENNNENHSLLTSKLRDLQNTSYNLDFDIKKTIFSLKAETYEVDQHKEIRKANPNINEICYRKSFFESSC